MSKVIVHIDLNQFFVRCEEIKNPSLIGKPVIIGHSGRAGIVSTCSYAARKYGVSSGMPTYKALRLCPDAILIGGNYHDYSAKSHEFINFVKKYTKIIEQASVDECYADFTEQLKGVSNPLGYFEDFQQSLLRETGLKCSIGIAPTKFLAKMGSDIKKPMGITIIRRKDVRKIIDPLPIDSFFGIGKKTTPRLKAQGIQTIGDLWKKIDADDPITKNEFGKFYYVIKDWISGYGSDVVDVEPWDPKSIGHSTTLPQDTNNLDEILGYARELSKEIADEAKARNKVGKKIQITLKDNEFKLTTRSKKISKSFNDFETIYFEASKLFEANVKDDTLYRLVGVTLQDLIDPSEEIIQMSIFDNYDEIKEEYETKLLIAELNRQMKGSVFKTASDVLKEKKNGAR